MEDSAQAAALPEGVDYSNVGNVSGKKDLESQGRGGEGGEDSNPVVRCCREAGVFCRRHVLPPPAGASLADQLHYSFKLEVSFWVVSLVCFAVVVAACVELLTKTPFEPTFWLCAFTFVFFVAFSSALTGVWLHASIRLKGKDPAKKTVKSVMFWLWILSLLAVFACLLLALYFVEPDFFFPSGSLVVVRLASVGDNFAKVHVRHPTSPNATIAYRLSGSSDPWIMTPTKSLVNSLYEDDVLEMDPNFVFDSSVFFAMTGLTASTAYEWKAVFPVPINDHSSPAAATSLESEVFTFTTFPAPGTPNQKFTFYWGSCFMHNFPAFTNPVAFQTMYDLRSPAFSVFIGDYIYADVPLYRGESVDRYSSLYRQSFMNKGFTNVTKFMPNFWQWDDHEVQNDWPNIRRSNFGGGDVSEQKPAVNQAWTGFLGRGNPDKGNTNNNLTTYYAFDYGDVAFFVLDTRGNRTTNTVPEGPDKSMIGLDQKANLKAWLLAKNSTSVFKLIMTPIPVSTDFPDPRDSWGGYLTERNEILDFIKANGIAGVVFFSGDAHFMFAFEIGGKGSGIFEFSASPLGAFDYTIGGLEGGDPIVPLADRKDDLLFKYTEGFGAVSYLGFVTVDTTTKNLVVEMFDRDVLVFNKTLTLADVTPK